MVLNHSTISDLKAAATAHSEHTITLVLLGVDEFDAFLREYGYPLGDQVLKHVESVCSEELDPLLLEPQSGGCFLVALPEEDSGAQIDLERVCHRIAGSRLRFTVDGQQIAHSMTISVGLSPLSSPQDLQSALSQVLWTYGEASGTGNVIRASKAPFSPSTPHSLSTRATLREALLAAPPDSPVSVIQLDIDDCSKVMEAKGREQTDILLNYVGKILRDAFAESGTICDRRSDEFLVILPGIRAEDAAFEAEIIRRAVADSVEVALPGISLSIGVAAYPLNAVDGRSLLRKVREARYASRMAGGGRVSVAEADQMVTKTSHFSKIQLKRLGSLAKRLERSEADLLREGLDALLEVYDDGAPSSDAIVPDDQPEGIHSNIR